MNPLYVGKSIPRLDGLEKVTGRAVYSVDLALPGMLHGDILRSPLPHARILEVDLSEARKVPGVKVAISGRDFPFMFGGMIKDQPFLAIDRVRYIGEPVAAVAGESELACQEALTKIRVRYEELPAVFDPRDALAEGAPLLHEGQENYTRFGPFESVPGTNICSTSTYALGNVQAGFEAADEIFTDEFYSHAVAHSPMEVHAALAQYSPDTDSYTVWSPTDGPHRRAKELSDALGIPINRIRFISMYSGGGFGGKGTLVAEGLAVAMARFSKGRPIKVVFTREAELTASQTRHAAIIRLKTGMKQDGTFTARQADIVWDKGAYASKGPDVAKRGSLTVFGPYRIPNLELVSRLVYTNKEIAGAYRGFGTIQVTWACEAQMDIIAEKLGMDPLEIRLKNCMQEEDLYINGQVMRGVGSKETLLKASQAIGWGQAKSSPNGSRRRGMGIATTLKPTVTPSDSYCLIKVSMDGSVTLLSSSVEVGAGQKTILAQIAADTIGVPLHSISVPHSDTSIAPFDFGVTSSRTTFHMGNAVRDAGGKVRRKILEWAQDVLKTDAARLNLIEGKILEEGVGERITLQALLAKIYQRGGSLLEVGHYSSAQSASLQASPDLQYMSSIFWMFATHAAEVEVDTQTGIVKVLKIAAAHDVGKAINPALCEQQIEGSVIMGLSNALLEEFKMKNGRILNDTLADYKLASMMDIPEIIPILVETGHAEGPFGAKGVGELAAAPTAPAIANAIFDAVGVRIRDLPLTPEKILKALREKK
ncbi:MAG: molybdopterin-dependent oxidoreductase [Burkholderiales bacterium]|nr:molybdopterin-dependent oxidoreductase [Burkholderiales bacterium]